jgi:DNA replication protein DnaC
MRCAEHHTEMSQLGEKSVCFACLGKASEGASQLWASFGERTANAALATRLRDANIPPEVDGKSFADFVAETDRATKMVQALSEYASTFATSRIKRKGFLFIGAPGTAKTHLACAMVRTIVEAGFRAAYASLPRLTRDLRAAYSLGRNGGNVEELLRKLTAMDFLVLDEIDLHGSSDNDYNTLYDIINTRYERVGFPTLAISNRPLDHLSKDLDERVVSRILAGTSPIAFDWPGRRLTRVARRAGAAQEQGNA